MTSAAAEAASTVVVHVTDELDLATLPDLRRAVRTAVAGRPGTVVVDLSDCPFTGVDAVQALATLTGEAERDGVRLEVVSAGRLVQQVVELLGLSPRLRLAAAPRRR